MRSGRMFLTLATVLAVAGCSAAVAAPAVTTQPTAQRTSAPPAGTELDQIAAQAIANAKADDSGDETPHGIASLAAAIATTSAQGWDDPEALALLDRVLAMRLPSGGWGLGYAWDAFRDGTTNPADTTYGVTLYQVGSVLYRAIEAGRHEYDDALAALEPLIYSWPRIPVDTGYALAYSDDSNDAQPGLVVHNVNASLGAVLELIDRAGLTTDPERSARFREEITRQEVATYDPAWHGWPYRDGTADKLQDSAHNAMSIEAMTYLAPGLADDAAYWWNRHSTQDEWGYRSAVEHLTLARLDPSMVQSWVDAGEMATLGDPEVAGFRYQAWFAMLAAEAAQALDAAR